MSEQVVDGLEQVARRRVIQCGVHREYFTIAYNSLEGLSALLVGLLAGSIALVAFGGDSMIEVTSGAVFL